MNKPSNITNNDWDLLTKKYKKLDQVKALLDLNYPVQYLIGDVDFYGNKILVNKNVLIPRFETETLVEKTINYIKKYLPEDVSVLELGTGSGCIPITLKKELPNLKITAIDKSRKALSVAKRNAYNNECDITFIKRDMKKFKPINKYSVLISNPPYIAFDEIIDPKCDYEPKIALYADNDGLEFYDYILNNYDKYMEDKFMMAFEIGYQQGSYLKKLAKSKYPEAKVTVEKDLAGKDRYLFIINM